MNYIVFFAVLLIILALAPSVEAGLFGGKKKKEKKEAAERDVMTGLAGMQQAVNDPAALAQLMKDMQDPEMMAEAKKMMEGKEFKQQMKKLDKDPNFKKAMEQTAKAFEDPRTAGMMEAKAQQMLKEGGASLDRMQDDMARAMAQMQQDPRVMKEMADLMSDPEKLKTIMNDPQVKAYMNQVEDLMKDPAMRQQMEGLANQFKAQL